jgi:hypothetical protein
MREYVEASEYSSLEEITRDIDVDYLFFSHTLCPYAERVWIALEELDEVAGSAALVHVDLANKPAWFRQVSRRGLVPSVLHKGSIHVESMDILEWLLKDSHSTAAVSELVSCCLSACGGNAGLWRVGDSISERQLASLDDACSRILREDMKRIDSIASYPFLYRTQVILKWAYGVDMGQFCDGYVGEWMRKMLSRPSCRLTSANEDLLGREILLHKSLDFFDYETYPIFGLHPHASIM